MGKTIKMKSFNPSYTRRWTIAQKENEFTFNPDSLTKHLQRPEGRSVEKKINTPFLDKERRQDSCHKAKRIENLNYCKDKPFEVREPVERRNDSNHKSRRIENLNYSVDKPFEVREHTELNKDVRKSSEFRKRQDSNHKSRRIENLNYSIDKPFDSRDHAELSKDVRKSSEFGR